MDPSRYKTVKTSRGINYSYFFATASASKPTLLFCHGFPSTSRDWRYIVPYFTDKGYGVIAPDMLGYGGTDKPTDPAEYLPSLMAKDMVDILNAEGIASVVAVGHDWGTRPVSRLGNYFPERVTAYAFLAAPYGSPEPVIDFSTRLQMSKQIAGYELFGYWPFFGEDADAENIILNHIDSFVSVMFPSDPSIWEERIGAVGGLKRSLLEDFQAPLPPYFSEQDKKDYIETFRKGGFAAPNCWYKVMMNQMGPRDDQHIPEDRKYPPMTAPIFYGAALQDHICLAAAGTSIFQGTGFSNHQVTVMNYDADHWLMLSHPNAISRDLEAWIQGYAGTVLTSASTLPSTAVV